MSSSETVLDFFGHHVEYTHLMSPGFLSRARFLPLANADKRDLSRASQPKPSRAFQGSSFQDTMQKLNAVLMRDINTQSCDAFSMDELHKVQRILFDARAPQLDRIYQAANDTRAMAFADVAALDEEQSWRTELTGELSDKAKAGLCHELVMWYTHHLTAPAREHVKQHITLPTLPEVQHTSTGDHKVHERYTDQVSCAICHVAPSSMTV